MHGLFFLLLFCSKSLKIREKNKDFNERELKYAFCITFSFIFIKKNRKEAHLYVRKRFSSKS